MLDMYANTYLRPAHEMKILKWSLCRKFCSTVLQIVFRVAKLRHARSNVLRQEFLLMYF